MLNISLLAKAVHKILFLYKMSMSEKAKFYGIGSKVNQFIYILFCNYMPNIRSLALAVLQIFCSQDCLYIVEKGDNSKTTRLVEEKKYGSAYFSCTCHIYNFKILA